ncbi:hypothetical protein QFC24_005842 [Naganishia onofrii]|uniref:Uncharacterized protein n=1 Tax=Naganishia onofrii TaxID=1851511 RepID=A0ACC2X7G1_9TREE|nr:hypothetical protein QFC24_005842 [Naganishia onofrii]
MPATPYDHHHDHEAEHPTRVLGGVGAQGGAKHRNTNITRVERGTADGDGDDDEEEEVVVTERTALVPPPGGGRARARGHGRGGGRAYDATSGRDVDDADVESLTSDSGRDADKAERVSLCPVL